MGCQVTFLYLKPFLWFFSLKVDRFFWPKKSAYTILSLKTWRQREVKRQDNPGLLEF